MDFLMDTCVWVDVERGVLAPADVAALTHEEAVPDARAMVPACPLKSIA
jgi:hypothetical protein